MCGIFCIISNKGVKRRIAIGLSFLEYRGYDSAGIALIDEKNKLVSIKVLGKVSNLIKKVTDFKADGKIGIGHTRWATHGKVTIENTHPILNENIAVVHNGTIENNNEIRARLIKQNYQFKGDTDTEVVLNLIQYYIDNKYSIFDAFKQTIREIKGNYAIATLFAQDNEAIYCAKKGSPLSFSVGDEEIYVASDVNALTLFVDKVVSLEDGDVAIIFKNKHKILNLANEPVNNVPEKEITRNVKKVNKKEPATEITGFPNYMLKEINEQPKIIKNIFNEVILNKKKQVLSDIEWKKVSKVSIIACGSSYNAGMVAKYWFETYAKISVDIDFASEFRARDVIYDSNALYIFISQSGETLDTLSALKEAKKKGVQTITLVNTLESSIANLSDHIVPIQAGVEISVASTKSFSAQLVQLANIVLLAALDQGLLSSTDYLGMLQTMKSELNGLTSVLLINTEIKAISNAIIYANNTIFLGRHYMYPIALEGALKLKELSYLPVFSSAAGELKHGPITLIDDNSLVIALAPQNRSRHKMLANVEEVKARGAKVVLFTDVVEKMSGMPDANYVYTVPRISEILMPLFYTIPLQLIAYQVALNLGRNVDRPRNLAKSVTVE